MIGAFLKYTPLPGEFALFWRHEGCCSVRNSSNYICPQWKPVSPDPPAKAPGPKDQGLHYPSLTIIPALSVTYTGFPAEWLQDCCHLKPTLFLQMELGDC